VPSKNSAGQSWGPHIAVIATKEDRGQEERATQKESTASAQFRSEENRWSGPGITAVRSPTIDGAGGPRSGQSAVTTPKRAASRSSPYCEGDKNHRPKIYRNEPG
jgi:hypothetical protein